MKTRTITPVDARHLQRAYRSSTDWLDARSTHGQDQAEAILDRLREIFETLDGDEILDIFRRLFLMTQLVSEIDAHWQDRGRPGDRPQILPFALYQLASEETAFEEIEGARATVFFARDVLDDAFASFDVTPSRT